jgi:hypothetical protein
MASSQPIKYNPHLDPERVGAIGVARYAIEYFAAAEATDEAIGDQPPYWATAPAPVMFLIGRSLELGLKAFLIHKNVPLEEIKNKIGHNLDRALAAAEKNGLSSVALSPEDRAIIKLMNSIYATKDLEYFIRGATTYPVYGPLQTVCKRVLAEVINEIPQARNLLRSRAGQIFESIQV